MLQLYNMRFYPFLTVLQTWRECSIRFLALHGSLFLLVSLLLSGCLQIHLRRKQFMHVYWNLQWCADCVETTFKKRRRTSCQLYLRLCRLPQRLYGQDRQSSSQRCWHSTKSWCSVSKSEICWFHVRSSGKCAIIPQASFNMTMMVLCARYLSGFHRMQ